MKGGRRTPGPEGLPALRRMRVRMSGAAGAARPSEWSLAEEIPVEIGFDGRPWTVMLASPCDLEDLALGLAFTEGAIRDPAAIKACAIRHYPEGLVVDLAVAEGALTDRAQRFRALEGRTGCGLCGVETLADAVRPSPALAPVPLPDDRAVARAFAGLRDRQPLNAATRSVHAAAWCSAGGGIIEVREDVGRHNALDKLIGALLRGGGEPEAGFIVMTSRCSMELVQKAAAFGAPLLATISAPTFRALALAAAAGLAIRCQGPDGSIVSFEAEQDGGES